MHAFSHGNRRGIARSTKPICTQSRSQSQAENPSKRGPQSIPNRSEIVPRGSPGAIGGPSVAQERKKAPQEGPQAAPRAPLGAHKGVPRATKAAQRAPRGGQRARQRDLGRGKIDPKSASEAKKVKFAKSAPRLGPADVPGTSPPPDRPRIGPKSSQVGPSSPSSGLLDRLWSLEGASSGLGARLRSTRAASGAPRGRLSCAPIRPLPVHPLVPFRRFE